MEANESYPPTLQWGHKNGAATLPTSDMRAFLQPWTCGHSLPRTCERFQKFTSIPVLEVAPYACNMRRLVTESAPGLCHQTQRMPCNWIAHQPRVRTGGPFGRCLENQLLAPASSLKSFACLYSPSRVVDYLAVSCLFSMPGFSADAQSNIFRQIDME